MTIHSAPATPNLLLNTWPLPAGLRERLQREHGWSLDFFTGAEREYRRFVHLATTLGPVTPSQTVDEVWHAHLMFTRDYWGGFQDVLPRPLHHEPGTGAPADPEHFQAQYLRTLETYEQVFGEAAPEHWWPRPAAPTSRTRVPTGPQARRGSSSLAVMTGLLLLILVFVLVRALISLAFPLPGIVFGLMGMVMIIGLIGYRQYSFQAGSEARGRAPGASSGSSSGGGSSGGDCGDSSGDAGGCGGGCGS